MSTEIEFYQRLSEHIPEEAARLIAERRVDRPLEAKVDGLEAKVDGLATRFDALATKLDLMEAKLDAKMATFATKADFEGLRAAFFRWNLAFFVPLWVGTYATLVAIVLRGSP